MVTSELFLLYISFFLVVGFATGYFVRLFMSLGRRNSIELEIKQILLNAREEAKNIIRDAQQKADEARANSESQTRAMQEKAQELETRLLKKEERLDRREIHIGSQEERLREKFTETTAQLDELAALRKKHVQALESVAGLSASKARQELERIITEDYEEDLRIRIRKLEAEGEERYREKAHDILMSAVHRIGTSLPSETVSTEILLPSENVKGKIIGKEGRNIRAFERTAGVELVIDDTPETVLVSSFDPVRRAVAAQALEALLKDGRIQPARIEQEIKKAQENVNRTIQEKGEAAVYECGIYNLDSHIIFILGRLHFRTSYGQNILTHSIEVSHLSGLIAEEVGADVMTAKTAGLLHDIGKAIDRDVHGSHVEVGKRILTKFSVSENIITAMQSHHDEYPFKTIEAKIIQVADSISASRPGARRGTAEAFLNRLEELEKIARSHDGVAHAFAVQAGREIRVFVNPEHISEIQAFELAKTVARDIEKNLAFPGEIKVTVIRESGAIEYAR